MKMSKGIKIAISVFVALIIFLLGLFVFREQIYIKSCVSKVRENQFYSARTTINKLSSDRAKVFAQYIDLRIDINSNYSNLLASFNKDKVTQWQSECENIRANSHLLPEEVMKDVQSLGTAISNVLLYYERYEDIRKDVLSMTEVFSEINRICKKDASGTNTTFTVKQVLSRVKGWEDNCKKINQFMVDLPGGEKSYLLNYLISEARGEFQEIRDYMQVILNGGYTETDRVRLNTDQTKTFQSITNATGVSLNVARGQEYEAYLYEEICRTLTEQLAPFYYGIN